MLSPERITLVSIYNNIMSDMGDDKIFPDVNPIQNELII